MYHWNISGPGKSALALSIMLALVGCQSGHEGSDDDTSPVDPSPTNPTSIEISVPSTLSLSEPISGSSTESIVVTLSSALSQNITLSIDTYDVTARSDGTFKNYDPISSQTLTIVAGEMTRNLPLNLVHNNLYEGSKLLHYTISAASSDSYSITNARTLVTLLDSDAEPTVRFSDASKTVVEGDSADSHIELSHYSHQDVIVNLEQSGIASSDDFTSNLPSLSVTIPAESLSHNVEVTAQQDGLTEGGESVIYTMVSSGNTSIDTSNNSLSFYIPGDKEINDTGFATYSDGASHDLMIEPANYPGQDATYGLDVQDGADHSNGEHGFKFTKLDYSGNVLANDAVSWSCVRDERTGMYIEAKQQPVDLPSQSDIDLWLEAYQEDAEANPYPWANESGSWRSSAYVYTWHDSESSTNGGNLGHKNEDLFAEGPISAQCAYPTNSSGNRRCDSEAYLANLNAYAVCGVTSWRLPSPVEARSIVNYSVGAEEPTTENYFPYMKGASVGSAAKTVLTRSSSVSGSGSAWCMDTQTGQVKLCNKGTYQGVIAVSGGVE
ncbi:Lcl domain-containing protein [Vibrio atypicus]|uniref:Lcl domain-containing protein n=1 Tax=Vibrio atypicus TaxID=558271 RepID=UPI003734CF9A